MTKSKTRRKPDLRGIKQCGENLYHVRVTWTHPATGRRTERQRLVEGELVDAIRVRDDLRTEPKRAAHPRLADYAHSWLESRLRRGRIDVSTADKYARDLDLHILPAIGNVRVDRLKPSIVEPTLGEGYAGVNRLRMLRAMAKDTVADGLCERDWTARLYVESPEGYTDEDPNRLLAHEARKLLDLALETRPQWYAIIVVTGMTGLRWGEVSALRWEDIDEQRQCLRIRRGNWKGVVRPYPKGKRRRTVPLSADLVAVLRQHRQRMLAEQHPGVESGWVFPVSRRRERRSARKTDPWLHTGSPLRRVLDELCAEAGVPRITAHGLRRTFNDLGRRVAAREVLQSITGHSTDAMTDHYSHVDHGEKLAAQGAVLRLVRGGAVEFACGVEGGESS